jgi:hypothetical protein
MIPDEVEHVPDSLRPAPVRLARNCGPSGREVSIVAASACIVT